MNLDFLENLQDAISKTIEKESKQNIKVATANINQTEIDLAKKLDAIQEFSLDRFEGEIAVLENRKTREITNIPKSKLPPNTEEGSIIKCINGKYILDQEKTIEKQEEIKNKMNNLWE